MTEEQFEVVFNGNGVENVQRKTQSTVLKTIPNSLRKYKERKIWWIIVGQIVALELFGRKAIIAIKKKYSSLMI